MSKRKLAFRLAAAAAIPALMLGQFGFSIVSDPTQEAHSWQQVVNDIQKIQQATMIYNQIAFAAHWTPIRTQWLGMATPIVMSTTRSMFGETAAWNTAANSGVGIPLAYSQATYAMNPPGLFGNYPIGRSLPSAQIASVEIADGASSAALLSIANSRTNQPVNDDALSSLETAAQDTTSGTNSEVQQLNQIASSTVLTNRQLEDSNALNTTVAEQLLISNKIQRDSLADDINFNGQVENTIASQPTGWGGSAQTISNW